MIRSNVVLIFCVLLLINASKVSGKVEIAEGVTLEAEFRPRFEFDNRDFSNATGYDAYGTMRTRVGLRLENLIENTNLYLVIGDSRMLGYANPYLTGIPTGPNGFDNNLGVNKVFVEVKDIWKCGTSVKIGRMSNDQGRGLIFGPGNWNLFGPRTYDGVKIGIIDNDHSFNIWSFYGVNGDRHWYPEDEDPRRVPDSAIDYKRDHTLNGMDLSYLSNTINILLFQDLDQATISDTVKLKRNIALNRFTVAANIAWESKNSNQQIDFDAAYQYGTKAHPGGNGKISAYMFAGDWSWHLDTPLKTWVGLGIHLVSGDDENDPDKVGYFYDNYSSKHKTFGYMDYFNNPESGMKPRGLQNITLRGGLFPSNSLSCNAELHCFTVEEAYQSVPDSSPSHILGSELDISLNYSVRAGLSLELGFDLFLPSDDWQGSSADTSTFIYAVTTFRI